MNKSFIMLTTLQVQTISVIDEDVFNVCATILVVALSMVFILSLINRIFSHRLKKKIIEKGIPDSLALSILKSSPEDGDSNLKWCIILAWLGLGIGLVHYTTPLGLHSLAIISLSLAAGFFSYFLYTKKSKN